MIRRSAHYVISFIVAFVGTAVFIAVPPAAHAADKDCGDFATQAAAQDFFIDHGGPQSDPHGLDDDGDGVACESNPCPCSTNQGGGQGGGDGGGGGQKKKHDIRVSAAEIGQTSTFRITGKVLTYRGKIQLQRNFRKNGYKVFKRTLAKRPDGRVSVRFDSPRGACFRLMVPETKKFRQTFRTIGCIIAG